MSAFPKDFLWGAASSAYQIEGYSLEDGGGGTKGVFLHEGVKRGNTILVRFGFVINVEKGGNDAFLVLHTDHRIGQGEKLLGGGNFRAKAMKDTFHKVIHHAIADEQNLRLLGNTVIGRQIDTCRVLL